MLTKEQIRNRLEVKPAEVEIESLGGTVFVRQFTLQHRSEFRENLREWDEDDPQHELWLLMRGVCNENGDALFENGDREWLAERAQSRLVQELAGAVLRENGWGKDAVEDAEGN